jgi:hypothetical protein
MFHTFLYRKIFGQVSDFRETFELSNLFYINKLDALSAFPSFLLSSRK